MLEIIQIKRKKGQEEMGFYSDMFVGSGDDGDSF